MANALLVLEYGAMILLFILFIQACIPRIMVKGVGFIRYRYRAGIVVYATIPYTPAARILQRGDEILDLQKGDKMARITFKRGYGIAIIKVPLVKFPARLVREIGQELPWEH